MKSVVFYTGLMTGQARLFIEPLKIMRLSHLRALYSYAYFPERLSTAMREVEFCKRVTKSVMFDSGAFTVEKSGGHIDIDSYIQFCKMAADLYSGFGDYCYIALDDMSDPEVSWINFQHMKQAGIESLPVWHLGESLSWLDRYADEPWICFGATSKKGHGKVGVVYQPGRDLNQIEKGCNRLEQLNKKTKVHILGTADPFALKPFDLIYSADGTSLTSLGFNGRIVIPAIDYASITEVAYTLRMGNEIVLSKVATDFMAECLNGTDPIELRKSSYLRQVYNTVAHVRLCKEIYGVELLIE